MESLFAAQHFLVKGESYSALHIVDWGTPFLEFILEEYGEYKRRNESHQQLLAMGYHWFDATKFVKSHCTSKLTPTSYSHIL